MIAGLPYDAEVEYLESTGTQYIEVGTIVGATAVEARLSATSIPTSGCYKAFGVGYNANFGDDAGINSVGWCSSTVVPLVADELVLLRYDANGRYVNGVNIGANGLTFLNGAAAGKSLFLFCGSSGTRAYITSSGNYMAWRGRIASYSVVGGNGNLRDFIPVRFTNELGQSEGAMYDRVSRKLFRNKGTGSFVVGPDVAVPVMGLHFMRRPRYTAKDYVRDGLVAMWDGIENAGWGVHDPNATAWVDLIGGVVAQLTCGHDGSSRNPNMYWRDNGLVYPDSLSCAEFSLPSLGLSTTIETSYSDFARVSTYFALFDAFDDSVNLFKNWSASHLDGNIGVTVYGVRVQQITGTESILNHEGDSGTVSMFFDSGFVGVQSKEIRAGHPIGPYTPSAKKWGIGGPFRTNFWTGNIHSFRLYSRALTADEVAANYAIDKERFNLP